MDEYIKNSLISYIVIAIIFILGVGAGIFITYFSVEPKVVEKEYEERLEERLNVFDEGNCILYFDKPYRICPMNLTDNGLIPYKEYLKN